jgi:BirA family transcriptional regulator, biotin operon repressor / biotin---[acetyl-CoA-carboxylase] ligase
MSDDLNPATATGQFSASLATRIAGREIRHVERTGSTNEDLKLLARAGAAEGLVLSTDEQTQGRGRRGRTWSAPPGSSLLCSTLLRPAWLPAADGFYLTILAAVAAAEAIESIVAARIDLKWPNDLQHQGRKLGGILVETELDGEALSWAIVGIGLNVNWDPSSVTELAATATSLVMIAGKPVSRLDLLGTLLQRLDNRYFRLRAGARQQLFDDWRSRLVTLGRSVQAEIAGHLLEGMAENVAPSGGLLIRDQYGELNEVSAGDVTLRGPVIGARNETV